MGLIGMAEAGRRMGVTSNSARIALKKAGVPLVFLNATTAQVKESDLESFLKRRPGIGRPKKKK